MNDHKIPLISCIFLEVCAFFIHLNIFSKSIPSTGDPIYFGSMVFATTDFIIAGASAVIIACPAIICSILVEYRIFRRGRNAFAELLRENPLVPIILVMAVIAYGFGISLEFALAGERLEEAKNDPFAPQSNLSNGVIASITVVFVLGTALLGVVTANVFQKFKEAKSTYGRT